MKTTICIFGDSIAWGSSDRKKGGWVNQLRQKLEADEESYTTLYNQGVSGETTEDLLTRFEVESSAREPNVIIFAIGINDSLYINTDKNPYVSLEDFQLNLERLITQAKSFTKNIVFVGLTKVDETKVKPIPWKPDKFYKNTRIEDYNSIIKKIATNHEILFIDVLDLLTSTDLSDGLHPNTEGHQKMLFAIHDSLLTNKII